MSAIEKSGVIKYKDANGQVYLMLPVTTADRVDGAVSFYEQELTDEEKAQAIANIGAISAEDVAKLLLEYVNPTGVLFDFRGEWTAGTYYYSSDKDTEVVLYNGCYYYVPLPEEGSDGRILMSNSFDESDWVLWIDNSSSGSESGTGGGTVTQVQTDWNQNDDTAVDFLKNKPFGIGFGVVFDEDVTTDLDGGNNPRPICQIGRNILPDTVAGDTVVVEYDGETYTCVAEYEPFFDNGTLSLGNIFLWGSIWAELEGMTPEEYIANYPDEAYMFEDTGEPFFMNFGPNLVDPNTGGASMITNEAGTHHFTISVANTVIKLDNKFINLDEALSTTSTNPVQNKAVAAKFAEVEQTISNLGSGSNTGTGTSSGKAIIDVVELPTENIDEDNFYRLVTGTLVYNRYDQTKYNYICHCVEELPEPGVAVTDINMSYMTTYYNVNDNVVYGYVDATLSAAFSYPVGWYDFATLVAATNTGTFSGVITDISEDPKDSTLRLLLKYAVYSYKGKWSMVGEGASSSLPEVTTSDNDKVLMVVDGVWTAGSITDGDEVSY